MITNNTSQTVAVIHTAFEDKPSTVALVHTKEGMSLIEKLEYAYRWTQNIMDSWSLKMQDGNDDVTVMGDISDGYGDCGLLQLVTKFWSVLKSMWSHQWVSQHLMENQYDEI